MPWQLLSVGVLAWSMALVASAAASAEEAFPRPIAHMKAGEYQAAIDAFDAVTPEDRNLEFYLHRALCWANINDLPAAHGDIAKAQSLPQRSGQGHYVRTDIEAVWRHVDRPAAKRSIATALYLGETKKVIELVSRALLVTPRDPELLSLRAEAYQAAERPADAIADLDAAVRLDPDNPEWYLQRSQTQLYFFYDNFHKSEDRLSQAHADLSRAIRLRPSAYAYYNRAAVLMEENDFAHAMDDFSSVLERSHADSRSLAGVYVSRGVLRQKLGDVAGAASDFDRARQLVPSSLDRMVEFRELPEDRKVQALVNDYWGASHEGFLLEELRNQRLNRKK